MHPKPIADSDSPDVPRILFCIVALPVYDAFTMSIDGHGRYTIAPTVLQDYRDNRIAGLKDPAHLPAKANIKISDADRQKIFEGHARRVFPGLGKKLGAKVGAAKK